MLVLVVLVELVLVVLVELVLVLVVLVVLELVVYVLVVVVVDVLVVPYSSFLVYRIARMMFNFLGGLTLSVQKSILSLSDPTTNGFFILNLN